MGTMVSVSQSFSRECAGDWARSRSGVQKETIKANFFIFVFFCRAGYELPLISIGSFSGDQFKVFIETGKIIKSAFITKLLDAEVVFDQQFAGVSDPKLEEETGIGLSGPGFEETAEGVGADIGHSRYLFQLDGPLEVLKTVFVDKVHSFVFGFGKAVLKADGRQGLDLRFIGYGHHMQR